MPDVDPETVTGGVPFNASSVDAMIEYRALASPTEVGDTLIVAEPLTGVNDAIERLILVWVIVGSGLVIAVIAAVWLIVRRGLRPVDDMITTAAHIADGEMSERITHTDPNTEVGRLGLALNTMLARIEAAFAARDSSESRLRQFVSDASHELCTPLTAIRGYAEFYRQGGASTPAEVDNAMDRIQSEGERLTLLVEDLLALARLDEGRPLVRETIDVVQLDATAVADACAGYPDHPIDFAGPERAMVVGDDERVRTHRTRDTRARECRGRWQRRPAVRRGRR